jgi:flagellar biosynthesis anti-sigma factor FlgM
VANAINGFSGVSVGTSGTTQQSARDSGTATTGNSQSPLGTSPLPRLQSPDVDEVRITGIASQLAGIGQKLSASPAIDAARVARISESIADGTYSISVESIASGLLQSEHALARIGM